MSNLIPHERERRVTATDAERTYGSRCPPVSRLRTPTSLLSLSDPFPHSQVPRILFLCYGLFPLATCRRVHARMFQQCGSRCPRTGISRRRVFVFPKFGGAA